jgi:ABC-2 type transport system permease protein
LELKQEHAGSKEADWSRAAHDYAGFGLQGLLFFAIEAAVGLSRERRQGIWKRLGASPVPSWMFIFSRGVSSTILALAIILLIFAIGAVLFGIRITGSAAGFALIAVCTALMCSMFGLLFATVGQSESQNRGIAILVILVMLATGGAWFPMERMPGWVQSGANYLPVRWAVEGFDAVTWRGSGLAEAAKASAALLAFATIFGFLAVIRFRMVRESS